MRWVCLTIVSMCCICQVVCDENSSSAVSTTVPASCQQCAGNAGSVPFGEGDQYCGRMFMQCICCRASLEKERGTRCAKPAFTKHNGTSEKPVDCISTIKAAIDDSKKNCGGAAASLVQAKARRTSAAALRRSGGVAPSAVRLAWDVKFAALSASDQVQEKINAMAGDPTAPKPQQGIGNFKDECEAKKPYQELHVKSCSKFDGLCGHPNGCNTQLYLEEMRWQRVDNWYRMHEGFPCA